MRPVYCAILLFGLAARCSASLGEATFTIIFSFEKTHSPFALEEMQRETERLLPVRINWMRREDLSLGQSFDRVAIITMKGNCEAHLDFPAPLSKRVALAYTHTSDGLVLPFADVECDRVRALTRPVNDRQLGRALGRVLAHEMHHILTRSGSHTKDGYTQPTLSSADLTDVSDMVANGH